MTQEEKIQVLRDLGYDVQIIDGKPTIDKHIDLSYHYLNTPLPDNLVVRGNLYLSDTNIKSIPDNLVVGGTLFLNNTKIKSLPKNLVIGGGLYLCFSNIRSLPDNFVIGGCLALRESKITSLPNNLIVGGDLDLRNTKIKSLPDNLVVGGTLFLTNTKIKSLPDNIIVGGSLDINGLKIKSLPNNLVVGGCFDLRNTEITSLPKNLVVGNWLDLTDTRITSLPDDLVVCGEIFLNDGTLILPKPNHNGIDSFQRIWSDKPYCKVDGIFTEVIKRRGKVWTVRKVGKTETFYLVTDGNGNYAHGETIKQAKADLVYKITNKDKSEYEKLTLDSTLTHDEAIECYRVITGACYFGTKFFVENILPSDERKDKYTIAEMIRLTEGQYGNETFAEFFESNK